VTSCFTEAPSLNETLSRALLRAGLTEDDIAARLGVDPKTVRRWLEGRALPYRRHRWALAALLGTAETDLWPQLRSVQPRSGEVVAIYPHFGSVQREVWLHLLDSAQHQIRLLDQPELPMTRDGQAMVVLTERARAGVMIRICCTDPEVGVAVARQGTITPADVRNVVELYAPLRSSGDVEIRLYQGMPYNFIYCADDQLLVAQRAYGVPAEEAPVLHLQRTDASDMFAAYVESFERIWADAGTVPSTARTTLPDVE
jgi:transcriptional regulator with XRE-family HTH domain